MSKKEFDRLEVLLGVQSGRLRVADACELLSLKRRQVARLDDRGGSVDRPPPSSALPASATPPARLLWRAGADRRLGTRVV